MSVALVHDWLTGMRGGEKCLEVFAELLPEAPILTLLHEPGSVSETLESRRIITSPLSRSRWLRRHYRRLLPLYPWATQQLPGEDYDLIVSLSHCAAKSVRRRPDARHICYCFTPARYLWDLAGTYLDPSRSSLPVRLAAESFLPDLQSWDRGTASHVDRFVAISHHIADRIRRVYGRESEVIYPPVDVARFVAAPQAEIEDHFLMVTALAPYKGVDLAIRVFNEWGRRLVIIGRGEDEARLRALAGPTIEFRGWLSDAEVALAYARCRSFLLPCDEDFGITPLEAMAAGRPVVALGRGGALETVVPPGGGPEPTGVFFDTGDADTPDPGSLLDAVQRLDRDHRHFDPRACRRRAETFDLPIFRDRIDRLLREERERARA